MQRVLIVGLAYVKMITGNELQAYMYLPVSKNLGQ